MNADRSQLSVHSPTHGVVVLDGEIDAHSAPRLATFLESFPSGFDGGLVIDMASVTFMDSSGLRILVEMNGRALAAGVPFALRSPSDRVARVIEISGLGDVLEVQTT